MSHAVRDASHRDIDAMAEVWVLADGKRRADIGLRATTTMEQARQLVSARVVEPRSMPVVVTDGGHVIGMAVGVQARENDGAGPGDVPGLLHVSLVAVVPNAWGRRLAFRMLTTLLDDARLAGFSAAQLWAHESNPRAIALYERLGFARSGRTKIDVHGEAIAHWQRTLS